MFESCRAHQLNRLKSINYWRFWRVAKSGISDAVPDFVPTLDRSRTFHRRPQSINVRMQRKQIVTDEQALRLRHGQATEDCRAQFRASAAQLAQEGDQIKKDYRASPDQMNGEIEGAAKRVRDISWRQNQAERKYLAYGALSFRNYSLRILRRS